MPPAGASARHLAELRALSAEWAPDGEVARVTTRPGPQGRPAPEGYGRSLTTDGDGAGETADHERGHRSGGTGEHLQRIRDALEPGRHDTANETKPDQTDCCSHQRGISLLANTCRRAALPARPPTSPPGYR